MKVYRISFLALALILLASIYAGCGSESEEDGGNYACSFETRVTDGCDGYGFGDWQEECFSFNADDYYITPQEVCDNVTTGGYYCEAGCCIDTEFRNVQLSSGTCP